MYKILETSKDEVRVAINENRSHFFKCKPDQKIVDELVTRFLEAESKPKEVLKFPGAAELEAKVVELEKQVSDLIKLANVKPELDKGNI
jgi:hypothetical protein